MSETVTLKLTADEITMLVDALEVDLDGYVEAAKEARANRKRDDVDTFTAAATAIQTLLGKLRVHVGDEDEGFEDEDED